ncbi:MAG: transporter, partial [Brevundimonas sp.]
MRLLLSAALIASTLAVTAPVLAQDASSAPRDFCADRPGKGTPTCVLDQGRWQVELG